MEMSYKQLEKTLTSYFRINPDRESTFRSRIKQLQRLEFPSGVNIGRGAKMTYTGTHLFKMVTAFELISLGLPAQTASQIVERHWPTISAGYGLAAIVSRWSNMSSESHVFLRIELQSLFEIQFARTWQKPKPSYITICDEGFVQALLGVKAIDRPFLSFLSANVLVSKVLNSAREQSGISDASPYDDEFVYWLPKETEIPVMMKGQYPDRSNIKMRQQMHAYNGNDPDSMTPDGQLEANDFIKAVLDGVPF